jgi:hypothetical protein
LLLRAGKCMVYVRKELRRFRVKTAHELMHLKGQLQDLGLGLTFVLWGLAHTHSLTNTHIHTYTCTYKHTHSLTHTHTHTHTNTWKGTDCTCWRK